MSTGRLIVHALLDTLTDLDALVHLETTASHVVYVDDLAHPTLRIVFLNNPGTPGYASSFTIENGSGTAVYAEGEYAVSIATFSGALTTGGIGAALAILVGGLTTIALPSDGHAGLLSLAPGLVLEGNDFGTDFTVIHDGTTVNAGSGDDEILIAKSAPNGSVDGGSGYDVLSLIGNEGVLSVYSGAPGFAIMDAINGSGDGFWTYQSIEFFRGSEGGDHFYVVGDGTRFEGGAGSDQFVLDGVPFADIIDYGGETGDRGVIVNFGLTMDATDLSWMGEALATALLPILGDDAMVPGGYVRDTFGTWDTVIGSFIIEGSVHADFFYGTDGDDIFAGDRGDDQFFGGAGDDVITGGEGDDTFYLSGVRDAYDVSFGGGVFTISVIDGEESDTVGGVEHFVFAGVEYNAEDLAPPANSAPVAQDDDNSGNAVIEQAAGVAGDATATGNVRTNDEDADGDSITVDGILAGTDGDFTAVGTSIKIKGTYGSVTIEADGDWTYELDDDLSATNALWGGTTAHDVFTYRISDGTQSAQATLDIAIAGSNDAPVTAADALTTKEDTALTVAAAALLGNDSDVEGTVSLVSVQGASHGTVQISGSNVIFTPDAGFNGAAGFSYTITDQQGRTATQQVGVSVTSVNDAPNGSGATLSVLEDEALSLSAADFGFSDPDGNALLSVIVTTLPTKGTLKLGSSTVGVDQEIPAAQLGNLTWVPPAGQSGAGFTTIAFRVRDNGGTTNGGVDTDATPGTITINVTPVNDAPNGVGSTVTAVEDTVYQLSAGDFGFSDPDGNTLREIIVTSLPGVGTLKLGSSVVVKDQVIAASQLADLTWTPPANASGNGLASFTFKVRDTGGTANGGADTDPTPGMITINVTPVNDAPNGTGSTITVAEDTIRTFAAVDFGFSDSDGNALSAIVIRSLPGSGTLKLGSSVVVKDRVITAAQLANLTWTPPANASGNGLASFTFAVRDTGATANGGVDTDPTPGTITINVTSVNDAPNGAGSTVTVAEDTSYSFAAADFGFSDLEGHALGAIVIASLPANGTLKLGSTVVTKDQVIAASQIASLTWTPPADANGDGLASFTFRVRDVGGTANGGIDTDPTPGRISFNVTPVNDRPGVGLGGAPGGAITLDENTASVTTVTTSDAESGAVALSLAGADAGDFVLKNGKLSFKSLPDYETPRDADQNNVYKVMIVATDSGGLTRSQDLVVTVRNLAGNGVSGDQGNNLLDASHRISGGKFATGEEDRIDGKKGDDTIAAGDGNDTIIGGAGKDAMSGGTGADQFVLNAGLTAPNVDTITDFKHDADVIALDDAVFKAIGPSLSAGEFYAIAGASAAHDANDRIIYNTSNGRLYYDADGNKAGGVAAVHFATLTGKPLIDAGDFAIV